MTDPFKHAIETIKKILDSKKITDERKLELIDTIVSALVPGTGNMFRFIATLLGKSDSEWIDLLMEGKIPT